MMDGKIKRRYSMKFSHMLAIGVSVVLILCVVGILYGTLFVMRTTGMTPQFVVQLVFDAGISLRSSDNRTNILILGVGGENHEGGDLTDTMMIVSIDIQKKSFALVSIPRDIWSETLKDKVNSAYHYGEEKKTGGGMLLAKVVAEDVIGLPVHYGMLLDFSGFTQIINALGGIDIKVPKAFTDTEYPIAGKEHETCPGDPTNRCVYETVHFDEGWQHMDGERTLVYVRSRHSEGEEGSDFSRARRQQDVVLALKDTMLHPTRWFSFDRINRLPQVVESAVKTDMTIGEIILIGKWFAQQRNFVTKKIEIDPLLFVPPAFQFGGRYVLVPKSSWDEIHSFILQQLH